MGSGNAVLDWFPKKKFVTPGAVVLCQGGDSQVIWYPSPRCSVELILIAADGVDYQPILDPYHYTANDLKNAGLDIGWRNHHGRIVHVCLKEPYDQEKAVGLLKQAIQVLGGNEVIIVNPNLEPRYHDLISAALKTND